MMMNAVDEGVDESLRVATDAVDYATSHVATARWAMNHKAHMVVCFVKGWVSSLWLWGTLLKMAAKAFVAEPVRALVAVLVVWAGVATLIAVYGPTIVGMTSGLLWARWTYFRTVWLFQLSVVLDLDDSHVLRYTPEFAKGILRDEAWQGLTSTFVEGVFAYLQIWAPVGIARGFVHAWTAAAIGKMIVSAEKLDILKLKTLYINLDRPLYVPYGSNGLLRQVFLDSTGHHTVVVAGMTSNPTNGTLRDVLSGTTLESAQAGSYETPIPKLRKCVVVFKDERGLPLAHGFRLGAGIITAKHSWENTILPTRGVLIEAAGKQTPMRVGEWKVKREGLDAVWLAPQPELFTQLGVQSGSLSTNMALAGHIQRLSPLGNYTEAWGTISQESISFDRVHFISTEMTVSGSPVFDRENRIIGMHRGAIPHGVGSNAKQLVNIMMPRSLLKVLITMEKMEKLESPPSNNQKGNDPDWREPTDEEKDEARESYALAKANGEIARFVDHENSRAVIAMANSRFAGPEPVFVRSWADMEDEEDAVSLTEEEQEALDALAEKRAGLNQRPELQESRDFSRKVDEVLKESPDFQAAPKDPGAQTGQGKSGKRAATPPPPPLKPSTKAPKAKVTQPKPTKADSTTPLPVLAQSSVQEPKYGSVRVEPRPSPAGGSSGPASNGSVQPPPPGARKLSGAARRKLAREAKSQKSPNTTTPSGTPPPS